MYLLRAGRRVGSVLGLAPPVSLEVAEVAHEGAGAAKEYTPAPFRPIGLFRALGARLGRELLLRAFPSRFTFFTKEFKERHLLCMVSCSLPSPSSCLRLAAEAASLGQTSLAFFNSKFTPRAMVRFEADFASATAICLASYSCRPRIERHECVGNTQVHNEMSGEERLSVPSTSALSDAVRYSKQATEFSTSVRRVLISSIIFLLFDIGA